MIEAFESAALRSICEVLADTQSGLTGSEIGRLLRDLGISDIDPTITKRDRLFAALTARQKQDRCGNLVGAFVEAAMNPVRYTQNPGTFSLRRDDLNRTLSFKGIELGEDGKLHRTTPATTLSQAAQRASRLRRVLVERSVHPEILRFARAELLQDNYFHGVLEAAKGVADRIRSLTGLTNDGAQLVDDAFAFKNQLPCLAFNSLRTDTEKSEQSGIMNLMKGVFGTFRNPTAHAPKISWRIDEADALDLLSTVSYLHRRLDSCVLVRLTVAHQSDGVAAPGRDSR